MKEGQASLHYLANHSAQKRQSSTNNLIKSDQSDVKELDLKFEEMKKDTINHSSSAKLVNQGEE